MSQPGSEASQTQKFGNENLSYLEQNNAAKSSNHSSNHSSSAAQSATSPLSYTFGYSNLLNTKSPVTPLTSHHLSNSLSAKASSKTLPKMQRTYGINPNGTPVHRIINDNHKINGYQFKTRVGNEWITTENYSSIANRSTAGIKNASNNLKGATTVMSYAPVRTGTMKKRNNKTPYRKPLSLSPKRVEKEGEFKSNLPKQEGSSRKRKNKKATRRRRTRRV